MPKTWPQHAEHIPETKPPQNIPQTPSTHPKPFVFKYAHAHTYPCVYHDTRSTQAHAIYLNTQTHIETQATQIRTVESSTLNIRIVDSALIMDSCMYA